MPSRRPARSSRKTGQEDRGPSCPLPGVPARSPSTAGQTARWLVPQERVAPAVLSGRLHHDAQKTGSAADARRNRSVRASRSPAPAQASASRRSAVPRRPGGHHSTSCARPAQSSAKHRRPGGARPRRTPAPPAASSRLTPCPPIRSAPPPPAAVLYTRGQFPALPPPFPSPAAGHCRCRRAGDGV